MGRHKLRTQLHFIDGNLKAQRYCEEILRPIDVPFSMKMHSPMSQGSLYNSWKPAYSPDILPIEYVWDALDRQVIPIPANIQQLRTAIEEWDSIPQATINSLINYVKEMCRAA